MKISQQSLLLVGLICLSLPQSVWASGADHSLGAELLAARRQQHSAAMRFQHYIHAEYPAEVLRLERAIRMTQAELNLHQRQIDALGPSSNFRYSKVFIWSLEEARIAALGARLRLDELREQRAELERSRAAHLQSLESERSMAQSRLAELHRQAGAQ